MAITGAAARGQWGPAEDGGPDLDPLEEVRAANRARILALAAELGTVSCPVLAERSGLSRQTVYLIADELERAGVLVDEGTEASGTRGRRPQLLRYEPGNWGAVGVEMREGEAMAVLTDLSGAEVRRCAAPLAGMAPADVAAAVEAAVAPLQADMPADRVLGLGVALPGLVDVERGIVRMSVLYGWSEVPFAAILRERIGLPAYVASRPAAAALGEAQAGWAKGARRLVYLYAGSSLGIGLAFDGDLYQGISSSAGELGHVTVVPDGPVCACGNRGCLNALASGNTLLARVRREMEMGNDAARGFAERCGGEPERLRVADLAELAAAGDGLATALVREAGRYVGIGVAGVINLLSPDYVLVGGPLAGAGELLLEAIREEAGRRALAAPFRETKMGFGALGEAAALVGAAALVLREAPRLLSRARMPTGGG